MPFFSRAFARIMRRRSASTQPRERFAGTHVGRRLRLLSYLPGQEQMEVASRLAQAELELRDSFSQMAKAGAESTGLAREVDRTKARVAEVLEEPAGWLPRALLRFPSSNPSVLRALEAVGATMATLRADLDRLTRDARAIHETRRLLSELERGYAKDLAREWQRAVVDRELMSRPDRVRSPVAVRRFCEEIEFLASHLEARYQVLVIEQEVLVGQLPDQGADAIGPPDDLGLEEEVDRLAELIRQKSQHQMKAAKHRIDAASADHLRHLDPTNKRLRELPKLTTVDDALRRQQDLHDAGNRRTARAAK
jgi:hypothetical protein